MGNTCSGVQKGPDCELHPQLYTWKLPIWQGGAGLQDILGENNSNKNAQKMTKGV